MPILIELSGKTYQVQDFLTMEG